MTTPREELESVCTRIVELESKINESDAEIKKLKLRIASSRDPLQTESLKSSLLVEQDSRIQIGDSLSSSYQIKSSLLRRDKLKPQEIYISGDPSKWPAPEFLRWYNYFLDRFEAAGEPQELYEDQKMLTIDNWLADHALDTVGDEE